MGSHYRVVTRTAGGRDTHLGLRPRQFSNAVHVYRRLVTLLLGEVCIAS